MEIEDEQALAVLPARLEDALHDLDAGIVHEDVDGSHRLLGVVDPGERDVGVAEVGLHDVGASFVPGGELVQAIATSRDERDLRAALQVLAGDRFADPAGCSGDDDVLGHGRAA